VRFLNSKNVVSLRKTDVNHVLSGYITTLKNKQKLDVSSEGPSSRVSSKS
jgi:hypothetical protein